MKKLSFGMTKGEIEAVLEEADLDYFYAQEDEEEYLCIEDSRYYCYFDDQKLFCSLRIQAGTSRDGRFALEMDLAELEKSVNDIGETLLKSVKEEVYDIYSYVDTEQETHYMFYVYENKVTVIWEMALEICICH